MPSSQWCTWASWPALDGEMNNTDVIDDLWLPVTRSSLFVFTCSSINISKRYRWRLVCSCVVMNHQQTVVKLNWNWLVATFVCCCNISPIATSLRCTTRIVCQYTLPSSPNMHNAFTYTQARIDARTFETFILLNNTEICDNTCQATTSDHIMSKCAYDAYKQWCCIRCSSSMQSRYDSQCHLHNFQLGRQPCALP